MAILAGLVLIGVVPNPSGNSSPAVRPGDTVERALEPGERHDLRLSVPGHSFLFLSLEPQGIELALELVAPGGAVLGRAGGAGSSAVPATLALVVEQGGEHGIVVTHAAGDGGYYRLRVEELRPAVPGDAWRVEAHRLYAQAARLAAQPGEESQRRALALYGRSLPLWRQLGDATAEATTLTARGVLQRRLGELDAAESSYRSALELWQDLGELGHQATTLGNLAGLERHRGRLSPAAVLAKQALELQRAAGDRGGEAWSLNRLGLILRRQGDLAGAWERYEEAMAVYEALGDREGVATVWLNLGVLSAHGGDRRAALSKYRRALEAVGAEADPAFEADVQHNLGTAHFLLGELEPALTAYQRALELSRETGRPLDEAGTLSALGALYAELGEDARAEVYHRAALDRFAAAGARRGESDSRLALAWLVARQGRSLEAREHLERLPTVAEEAPWDRARRLERLAWTYRELGETGTAAALLERALGEEGVPDPYLRARLDLHLGRLLSERSPEPARRHLERALAAARDHTFPWLEPKALAGVASLELARGDGAAARSLIAVGIERARSGPPPLSPDLAGPWRSDARELYELAVRALLLDPTRPAGRAEPEAAFRWSEEARSRALEELLAQGEIRASGGLAAVEAEERELHRRVAAQAAAYGELLASPAVDDEEVERQQLALQELLSRHEALSARLRGAGEQGAVARRGASVQEAQALLAPGTLLLEYFLTEEASFLWALTAESWGWYLLPGRQELEDAARAAHSLLAERQPVEGELSRLSRLLLGPVAEQVAQARAVAIVPDGALAYLPFAALPMITGDPLGAGREVVQLPSAGAVTTLRRRAPPRRPTALAAVLADPVYSPRDARLAVLGRAGSRAVGVSLLPAARFSRSGEALSLTAPPKSLRRLRFSRQEAEAVARAAQGRGEVWTALDFAASREAALSGELERFRIVHFATHGLLDSAQPRFSALVLSQFDADGRPVDGSLRLHDVYALRLAADLVVLSGCRTALGREVRGEGVVGLTGGFLQAGARQVLATLWEVDDRSTAVFMALFYEALLGRGLSPAAALAEAQRELRQDPRWRHPTHWAPYVLIGDPGPGP